VRGAPATGGGVRKQYDSARCQARRLSFFPQRVRATATLRRVHWGLTQARDPQQLEELQVCDACALLSLEQAAGLLDIQVGVEASQNCDWQLEGERPD